MAVRLGIWCPPCCRGKKGTGLFGCLPGCPLSSVSVIMILRTRTDTCPLLFVVYGGWCRCLLRAMSHSVKPPPNTDDLVCKSWRVVFKAGLIHTHTHTHTHTARTLFSARGKRSPRKGQRASLCCTLNRCIVHGRQAYCTACMYFYFVPREIQASFRALLWAGAVTNNLCFAARLWDLQRATSFVVSKRTYNSSQQPINNQRTQPADQKNTRTHRPTNRGQYRACAGRWKARGHM